MNDTIKYKSLELYIDTSYKPEEHRRQWGIMVSDFEKLGLKKGEKVYFHYLTLDAPPLMDDKWVIDYQMIYCVVRDNEIIMLHKYNLITIEEDIVPDSTLISIAKKSTTRGFVAYTSHYELKQGDEVLFKPTAAFVNEIEETKYYLVETEDIIAKIK